jgi:O-antigen ligase
VAWWWPRAALVGFVTLAPLLPIVPSLAGWPQALSLAQAGLTALLAARFARIVMEGRSAAPPATVVLFAAWVTASLVVALWPLQLVRGGLAGLVAEVHAFAGRDLLLAVSQRHLFASVVAWAVLLEGLALLWLLRATLVEAGDTWRRRTLAGAAFGAAAAAAVGVVQWWTRWNLLPFWLEVDPNITRVNATFSDVNAFGAFLASMAPVVAAVAALSRVPWWRVPWSLAFVLTMAATVFSGSRAAWLALLAGMAVYGGLLLRYRLVPLSRTAEGRVARVAFAATATVAAAFVVLSVVATVRDVRHAQQDTYFDTVLYTLNFRTPVDERLKGRATLWTAAGAMIRAEPIEGIGLGRYFKDVSSYVGEGSQLIRPQENAHNYLLQLAAELGLPGVVLFLSVVGLAVGAGLRASRDPSRTTEDRRLTLAASAGVVAFLVTCLTGHSLLLRDGQLAFWVLPACAWMGAGTADTTRRGRRVALAVAFLAIAATLPLRTARQIERVDLSRVTEGFYAEERDTRGESFRWTGSDAAFHVPAGSRAFVVRVRRLAPFAQRLVVVHDGRTIDEIDLPEGAWHTLRYLTPRSAPPGTRFHRIDLRVAPTWHPPGDGRELGVMVGDVRAEP